MFITLKKWTVAYILCIILMFLSFGAILQHGKSIQTSQTVLLREERPTLIIDPGHGGEDGGAVAPDGTIESHINLSIALKAAEIAKLFDWPVCMTRYDDISIYDQEAKTLRQKKVSDLKNRVELCNSVENGVLISLHQNSLPGSPNVRGAQVFYSKSAGSFELAQTIQDALNASINRDHPKTAKAIGESSYLMKNAACPAVLVECAFLSNADETRLLNSDDYQTKLASVIIASVTAYLSHDTK